MKKQLGVAPSDDADATTKEYVDDNTLKVKMGTFTISSTGSQAITGVGFQPKFVEFRHALDASAASLMVGGAASSTDEYVTWMVGRTSTSHGDDSNFATNKCIAVYGMSSGGSADLQSEANFTSMDSDGFTINVTDATVSHTFVYIAFG